MQNNAFAKQLATIVGIFGICANLAGTLVSLISGLAHFGGSENFIIDTLVCFLCALLFFLFFFIFCIKQKNYNKFNGIAVAYCGFLSFPAMYIVTGNLICGFPFYMMIIPTMSVFRAGIFTILLTINKMFNTKSILLLYLFLKDFTHKIIDMINTIIEIIAGIIVNIEIYPIAEAKPLVSCNLDPPEANINKNILTTSPKPSISIAGIK